MQENQRRYDAATFDRQIKIDIKEDFIDMSDYINIYCDESCHLENDGINVMGIGGIWCAKDKIKEINQRIKDIKVRNGVSQNAEVKWTKIAPAKEQLYMDLVNYFFDDDDLHFRGLIVPNKAVLEHEKYNQTHEDFYYKMYFEMLKQIFLPTSRYNVYVDIKDTNSSQRIKRLHDVCCNNMYDFSHGIIKNIQPIRSHEVQAMQLVDILLGALVFINRQFDPREHRSEAKKNIIELISKKSGYSLTKTTLLREEKFNIFVWEANHGM